MLFAIKILRKSTQSIAYIAMALMAIITFIDVFGRVLFNSPLGFAYEAIGVFLGIAVFAGLFDSCLERDHIRVDLFDTLWHSDTPLNKIRELLVWTCELAFFLMVAIFMVKQVFAIRSYGEEFMFLPLERWIPLSIITFFSVWAAIAHLLSFLPQVKNLRIQHPEAEI